MPRSHQSDRPPSRIAGEDVGTAGHDDPRLPRQREKTHGGVEGAFRPPYRDSAQVRRYAGERREQELKAAVAHHEQKDYPEKERPKHTCRFREQMDKQLSADRRRAARLALKAARAARSWNGADAPHEVIIEEL